MRNFSVFAILLFLALSFFSACDDVPPGNEEHLLLKGDTAERTLVIYMMAENRLTNFASSDIDEVKRGALLVPNDCRLFVFVDDCSEPRIFQYYNSDGVAVEETVHSFTDDFCSSDTAVFNRVIGDLLYDFPTRALDLVLWSHGDGWLSDNARSAPMRTIGVDNGRNAYSDLTTMSMEIDELAAAITALPVKVDRLMFDACFMQGVEVAFALRNAVEWVIASPAEIPGDGAPYDTVVEAFFASDGVEDILDSYKAAYGDEFMGVVLSAAYMPAMQGLADVIYPYVCTYFNSGKKREYIDVFSYLPGGVQSLNGVMPCYYDANAIMKKYLTADEYVVWSEALAAAVPYTVTTGRWYSAYLNKNITVDTLSYSGISMYMPQNSSRNESLNADFATTEWYQQAGWSEAGW